MHNYIKVTKLVRYKNTNKNFCSHNWDFPLYLVKTMTTLHDNNYLLSNINKTIIMMMYDTSYK